MRPFHTHTRAGPSDHRAEEVVGALTRKTGRGTELSEEAARATWQRWAAEFDMDKDGKISYRELTVEWARIKRT